MANSNSCSGRARSAVVALRSSRAFALAIFLATIAPSAALADARTEARRHFRHGMDLVVAGQVDEGIAELEEAYAILPHPNVLYNIGRAYAEVGRYDEARDYFDRYLESDPPDREEVRAIVAAIDQRIAAQAAAAATTEPTTTEPTVGVESTTAATTEQLEILDSSIAQIQGLCDATHSTNLCDRAAALRALRDDLAARSTTATTEPTTTQTTTEPCVGENCPEATTESGLAVGASTSEEAAYVERVDAASRGRSSSLDAPASTTIITRQDIRLSGVTQIAEILRRAAGVSVMNTTPGGGNVAIRGFNRLLSPRVLMLINGRTTYVDSLGTPFWDAQPIQVEDIERIEIIRGPASVLYGANGMSGIVNVVLRAPGEDPGTELSVAVGNAGQVRGHAATSGRVGDVAYRFHGGYQQLDRYAMPVDPNRVDIYRPEPTTDLALAQRETMFGGQLRYRASENVTLVAEGGTNYLGGFNFYATGAALDFFGRGSNSYASLSMLTPYGRIRTFYNRLNLDFDLFDSPIPTTGKFENNTFDVEAEFARQFHLGIDHNVHLGVNYRLKNIDWGFLVGTQNENHIGVFLEDTMTIGEHLRLVAAVRMDKHPLLPTPIFSPRGAVIIRPTEGQAIRLTAGTAFRTPSVLDTDVSIRPPTPITGADAAFVGSDVARRTLGRPRLDPEHIRSFEVGYLNQESDFVSFEASAYYNQVRGLIGIANNLSFLTLADYGGIGSNSAIAGFDRSIDGWVAAHSPLLNEPESYHVFGGEAGVRVFPIDGLDMFANYSLNTSRIVDSPFGQDVDHRVPAHMVNLGAQYRARFGLDLSADFHYSSPQTFPEFITTAAGITRVLQPVDAFYLLNARIGWRFLDDKLEVSVAGYNITNVQRRQYPLGQPVDSRVLATLSARF